MARAETVEIEHHETLLAQIVGMRTQALPDRRLPTPAAMHQDNRWKGAFALGAEQFAFEHQRPAYVRLGGAQLNTVRLSQGKRRKRQKRKTEKRRHQNEKFGHMIRLDSINQ